MELTCPQCGGSSLPTVGGRCPHCGAECDDLKLPERPQPSAEVAEFFRAIYRATPTVYVTPTLVGLNLFIYVLMVACGVDPFSPRVDDLLRWGANAGHKTLDGEWWRLLTAAFVHGGMVHIGFNMWVLWDGGRFVERLIGHSGFLMVYLVCGVASSLVSLYWSPEIVSVGASGAVFGVFGVLLAYLVTNRHRMPLAALRSLRNSGMSFLVVNLLFGAVVPGINVVAHASGLAVGFVLGLVVAQPLDRDVRQGRRIRNLAAGLLSVAALAVGCYFAPEAPADRSAILQQVFDIEKAVIRKFNDANRRSAAGTLGDLEFAQLIDEELLPSWRRAGQQLEAIQDRPRAVPRPLRLIGQYWKTREEAWTVLAAALRETDPQRQKLGWDQFAAKDAAAEQLLETLNQPP